jgi:hypothetical protein
LELESELARESELGTGSELEKALELETESELEPATALELVLGSDWKWVSDLVGLRKIPLFLSHRTRSARQEEAPSRP